MSLDVTTAPVASSVSSDGFVLFGASSNPPTGPTSSMRWLSLESAVGVVNVKAKGAVGDGVTDDTAALQAALTEAGSLGKAVHIPAPPVKYRISARLTVPAGVQVTGTGYDCVIEQTVWPLAVFDLLDAHGASVRNVRCVYTGPRIMGEDSFRGDNAYGAGAAVYTNADWVTVENVWAEGLPMGVTFSSWDTATDSFNRAPVGNKAINVTTTGVDHGILCYSQQGIQITGLYSYDHSDSSAGVNPLHAIYFTNPPIPSRNIMVSGCLAENIGAGVAWHAYQFKNVQGGIVAEMFAIGCSGIINLRDVAYMAFNTIVSLDTRLSDENGAITTQLADEHDLEFSNIFIQVTSPETQTAFKIRGDRITLRDVRATVKCTDGTSETPIAFFRGAESVATNLTLEALDPDGQPRGLRCETGTVTIRGLIVRGCRTFLDVAGATVRVDFDPDDCEQSTTGWVGEIIVSSGGTLLSARRFAGDVEIDGALNHDGTTVGFYGAAPVAKQTGVPVSAAGIHAALVNLGLISA